ncbi:aminotriazole resistance [Fusarium sporotrichioides]|uniref:Aminotriazole resistance n=1 Tax=Fusarium sporotrichioides TaxID=5514 RepID=A0A395SEU3_FUSSP|nr:aminotriazole resistance [Fusarium sporotrichioides]
MATTQTITETPFESISLEDRNGNQHVAEQQENRQARRVFEADPAFTITLSTRRTIIALLVCANTVQFVSNAVTIAGGLALSKDLGRESGPGKANWMVASYPLTQGAFVLVTGRLGAIYGHKQLSLLGCTTFTLFSFVNAFTKTYDSFIAMRALTGVGGGIFMPNAVSVITTMVPPGQSRNVVLGFFAASPPLGGMVGALITGVFMDQVNWMWIFILIAGVSALILVWLAWLMPKESPVDKGGHIDVPGILMGLGSLLLFNIACNQAPSVGWNTPYEIALIILSVLLFAAFLIWEKGYAKEPIMPLSIFRAPTFLALIFVVLLSYMAFGIGLWYAVAWQQLLRGVSLTQTGIQFIPFGLSSIIAVFFAAWLIPRVAAQWIMAIGVLVTFGGNILLATMPVQQTFWAQVFPAMVLYGFCPDLVYVAAQVIASNSVNRRQQGIASSLIGTLNLYGNSLGQGFAGTIETEVATNNDDEVRGYRAALYFAAGLAVLGLALDILFVRLPKDQREGWDDPSEGDEQGIDGVTTAIEVERSV